MSYFFCFFMAFFAFKVIIMNNKRELPDKEKINKRAKYMKDIKKLVAIEPVNRAVPNGPQKRCKIIKN